MQIIGQIDQAEDALEQVKISLFTPEFVLPPERFITQENGGVTLTAKGDNWFLRCVLVRLPMNTSPRPDPMRKTCTSAPSVNCFRPYEPPRDVADRVACVPGTCLYIHTKIA